MEEHNISPMMLLMQQCNEADIEYCADPTFGQVIENEKTAVSTKSIQKIFTSKIEY